MADLAAAFAAAHADSQVLQEDVEPIRERKTDPNVVKSERPPNNDGDVSADDSSSSSDGTSSSDSEDSEEDRETLYDEINAGIGGDGSEYDDEELKSGAIPSFPKTKNEILPHELHKEIKPIVLEDEMTIEKVGAVMNLVDDSTVLVQTQDNGQAPLDQGSILCVLQGDKKTRLPLGSVDEIFGPIGKPLYVVRLTHGSDEAEELRKILKVNPSIDVYSVKEMAKVIDPNKLDRRGSDASNRYDEEVDDGEKDFSDDEEEARARRERRNLRTGESADGATSSTSRKRVRVKRRGQQHNSSHQMGPRHEQGYQNYSYQSQNTGNKKFTQSHLGYNQMQQGQSYSPPMLQPPSAYARGMQYHNPQFMQPPPYTHFMMGHQVRPQQQDFYGPGWQQQNYYPAHPYFRPPPMYHPPPPSTNNSAPSRDKE